MEIDDYTLIKLIAETQNGEIYLGFKKRSPKIYALKKLFKSKYFKNSKGFKYLENEITILKDLNHPNILKLIDVKETLEDVYIITEYYNGGTLEEYLYKNKKLSEEIVQYIMKQVIDALINI